MSESAPRTWIFCVVRMMVSWLSAPSACDMVGVLSPLLLAVCAPDEETVGISESEWLGVWPACIVSRADSSAAKTCSVCSLEPCELILGRLEPEGGDEV